MANQEIRADPVVVEQAVVTEVLEEKLHSTVLAEAADPTQTPVVVVGTKELL